MPGYFRHLYTFLCEIKENSKNIEKIIIANTKNACNDFKNIKLTVEPKCPICYHPMLWMEKRSQEEEEKHREFNKRKEIIYKISPSYSDYYKFEYETWTTMVYSAWDIFKDITDAFNATNIDIIIDINILGYKLKYEAEEEAEARDIQELYQQRSFDKYIQSKIRSDEEYRINIWNKFQSIEKQLKSKHHSYILSKLVDNKANINEFKNNPDLIEAYDAYIDLKKLLTNHSYK